MVPVIVVLLLNYVLAGEQCPRGRTPCAYKSQCISMFSQCDGDVDCKDGSDERPGCGSSM